MGIRSMILAAMAVMSQGTFAAADGKRLVLLEEFTNTSCAPCAEFAPYLDTLLAERMNDVVAITYHYNFPSPSDPFYLAAKHDVDTRAAYYGVTGVPTVMFNGIRATNFWHYLSEYVDMEAEKPEQAQLEVRAAIDGANLEVEADVALQEGCDAGSCRLFAVVVEEQVQTEDVAPNGETHWNYVMRKMLPSASGQQLAKTGSTETYRFEWQADNLYKLSQLGIVTFVQDMQTGEVLATRYTPYPSETGNAAKILKVDNTPESICVPEFGSRIIVRNTGCNVLKSANVNVEINGSLQTIPWTGEVGCLQCDTLSTEGFTDFELTPYPMKNKVKIWLSAINGDAAESAPYEMEMKSAVVAEGSVRLTIMTDRSPEETTWVLYNSAGDKVDSGGPYNEPRQRIQHLFALDSDDCYMLEFYDTAGNGISGDNGRGYYKLDEIRADGSQRMMCQGEYTTATHQMNFSLHNAMPAAVEQLEVCGDATVTVTDIAGKRRGNCDAARPAEAGLPRGVYVVRDGSGKTTKRIVGR